MRFFVPLASLLAAVAVAQTSCTQNCILIPNGGLQVTAGGTVTLTWSNPSSGTITIKLQDGTNITPGSGLVLISGVDASTESVVVSIPSNLPPSSQYTFETVDESNTSIINFSPMFSISGATGTSSLPAGTSSSASTVTSSGSTSMHTSTLTGVSNSTMTTTKSSTSNSASMTSSQSGSQTSSSSSASQTTSAPNSNTNGASSLTIQGAWIALIAGALAAF